MLTLSMIEFINEYKSFFWILAAASTLLFLLSLLLIPLFFIRIPGDYFMRNEKSSEKATKSPLKIVLIIFRNFLGWLLMICGVAMLLLPGQGFLTIIISLTLIDFPHKRKFEYYLISRPLIIKTINRLRKKAGVAPLRLVSALRE